MKRICTRIATFCLLAIAQNSSAQTCSISTTNPNPSPGYGINLNVNPVNGFTSSNQAALGTFPKMQTTELTSPIYYYNTPQPTIYFRYTFTIAQAGTTTTSPIIRIIYGANGSQSFSCTSAPIVIQNGTHDLYFSITPGTAFPAQTNFMIELTMGIENSDKAVTANSLATNAILAGAGAVLPVKLTSFQGTMNKNKVQLNWLVAENETARKFEIQRSTNGSDFTTVATINASQKSGDESYSFNEVTASARVLYRLKMYDVDSRAEYSKTLVFNAASAQNVLQVLTNPVKEKLVISFTSESNDAAQVNIYDNLGRVMQRQLVNASQGINTTTVALNANYRSGLYIVELVTKNSRLSEKVIYSNQ